ncbi:DUF4142 domain-containing protein [Actinoplanes sp. NPDC049596]
MLKSVTALAVAGTLMTPALPASAAAIQPVLPASAAATQPAQPSGAAYQLSEVARPSKQDRTFLRTAHQSHVAEIAGARIAQRRATSDEVKALAARLIRDHTAMDADLTAVARRAGVALPKGITADQRRRLGQYESFETARFDLLYVLTQLVGHQVAMNNGETEVKEGTDPRVVQLAKASAPIVKAHHHDLTKLREQMQPL